MGEPANRKLHDFRLTRPLKRREKQILRSAHATAWGPKRAPQDDMASDFSVQNIDGRFWLWKVEAKGCAPGVGLDCGPGRIDCVQPGERLAGRRRDLRE